jgi:hypothetical protein
MKNVLRTVNVRNKIKHSAQIHVFHMIERNVRDIVTNNVITNVRSVVNDTIKIDDVFHLEINLKYSETQLKNAYKLLETL